MEITFPTKLYRLIVLITLTPFKYPLTSGMPLPPANGYFKVSKTCIFIRTPHIKTTPQDMVMYSKLNERYIRNAIE
jgi:hypothetical protein